MNSMWIALRDCVFTDFLSRSGIRSFNTSISFDKFVLLDSQLNVHGNPETEFHKKQ